ncbi:MAG: J domain-containing protein [Sphingomonas sp.]|nr:J domain-containing protein [Sphingomonas sp.]
MMMTDHYATLGLAPNAEHSAIRVAYLTLMRRYHPDRNQSADAAVRVREITAAYEVLADPDSRIDYDLARALARAEMAAQNNSKSGMKPAAAALLAVTGAGLLMLLYLVPFAPRFDLGAGRQAAVPGAQVAPRRPQVDRADQCSAAGNAESIKQELFTRAARIRGSDRAIFKRLAASSVLRLQTPSSVRRDAGQSSVYCYATIGLDLPPGVEIPGGRRSLSAEIGYSLKPASEGGGVVLTLFHDGAIAGELATIVPVRAAPESTVPTGEVEPQAPAEVDPPLAPPAPPVAVPPQPRMMPERSVAKPPRAAPRCGGASVGAVTACTSPAVAGLDRSLGTLFRQSVQLADPARQRTLYRDHYRFIARLDQCRSEACARGEYLGRMREISDTMATGAPKN